MNKVLICVTSCNRQPYTKQCLESLLNNTDEPFDLIIIDNGSAQPSLDLLKNFEGKVFKNGTTCDVVYNKTNRGVAPALNQGLRKIKPNQHFMKLDNDMVIPDNHRTWLTEMIDILENNQENIRIVALSPFVYERKDHFRRRNIILNNNHEYKIEDPTGSPVLGPGKLVHNEVIRAIGAYNETFGKYGYEDTDYALRALRMGFRNIYYSECKAKHIDDEQLPESKDWRGFKDSQLRRSAQKVSAARIEYAHDRSKVRIPL